MKAANHRFNMTRAGRFQFVFLFCCALFLIGLQPGTGQEARPKTLVKEVEVKFISAEITKFAKPFRFGVGKRMIAYQEALVLKLQVDRQAFDSLPPDIEPFLYIGSHEYHIFHIDRQEKSKDLVLTFHILDWERLEEGSFMVLTIDHGAPIRYPEKFALRPLPRFKRSMIIDKR